MAQSGSNPVGVDNTFRRKFNREEYLERAREREQQEEEARTKPKGKAPPIQRKPLKHRDYEVDLESRLGKTQVVTPIAPLSQQAGYYCSVCECVVKDSANYLDHINGKKHQRALGMSMRVERASLQQVQDRFDKLKKQKVAGSFSEQGNMCRVRFWEQNQSKYPKGARHTCAWTGAPASDRQSTWHPRSSEWRPRASVRMPSEPTPESSLYMLIS